MSRPKDPPPDLEADTGVRGARARLNAMLEEGYRSAREEPTYSLAEAMAVFDLAIVANGPKIGAK